MVVSLPHRSALTSVLTLVLFATSRESTDGLCDVNGCDSSDDEKFAKLFAWAQDGINTYVSDEHRVGLPQLTDALVRRGRTFIAKREQHAGDLLMRIPRQRLIHAGYYKACGECPNATLAAALKNGIGSNKSIYMPVQSWLALYIMEQRRMGHLSQWNLFFSLLPTDFNEYPIFYAPETFDWLRGSTFVARANKRLKNIKAQFQTVCDLVPGFAQNYTIEEFLWARSIVGSRSFGWKFPGLPPKDDSFLAPLGDMFNHRAGMSKMVEWQYNESTDSLDYWVREEIAPGDELLISYGTHSNANFLLHYGFVVPDLEKSDNAVLEVLVAMDLEILDDLPDRDAKKQWLIKATRWFTDSSEYIPVEVKLRRASDKEFDKMLGHARLLELGTIREVEERTLQSSQNCKRLALPPNCEKPVSLPNERAALKRCLKIIRAALMAYPTTLEDDEKLLPVLQGLKFSLVTIRRDEKVVLRWWEKYLLLALELLEIGQPYTWTGADKVEQRCKDELHEKYCTINSNKYLRVTLFELLGGVAKSAARDAASIPITMLFVLMYSALKFG